MANVLFTRKNASEIPNVPITDGQLIFDTSGNGKMYLDNGTERLEMGGALTVDATLSKTSTNPIQNKAVAGVMLDNLEDISNVTNKGFLPDALAVKELNSSLENIINNNLDGIKMKMMSIKNDKINTTYTIEHGINGVIIGCSSLSLNGNSVNEGVKIVFNSTVVSVIKQNASFGGDGSWWKFIIFYVQN